MALTLRIENHDSLPDGGPLSATVTEAGLEIGRDSSMGWTLPDPNRFISSRHMEIRHERGAFWLYDLSTNGTYLNGASSRMKSPHRLEPGDRLQVGPYRIVVEAGGGQGAMPPRHDPFAATPAPHGDAGFGAAAPAGGDIWSIGAAPAPAPVPGFDPRPPGRSGDFGDQHIEMPRMAPDPAAVAASPFGAGPQGAGSPALPAAGPGGDAASPFGASPLPSQPVAPQPAVPQAPPRMPMPEAFQPAHAGHSAPAPAAAAPQAGDAGAVLDAICAGAGLPAGTLAQGGDPLRTAEDIGRLLRVVAEDLAALLRARAATRQSVRSGQRTMIGASDNNPLKFLPSAEEALETMFGRPRPGFMRGATAVQAGFADVKQHQYAVHAALQPALARLLEDLAPEVIEAKAGSSLMSSRKARAWEIFVERWDAKTHPYENGMLDVFLAYYAEAYDQALKRRG